MHIVQPWLQQGGETVSHVCDSGELSRRSNFSIILIDGSDVPSRFLEIMLHMEHEMGNVREIIYYLNCCHEKSGFF